MEYGATIVDDRRRFRFVLFLPMNQGTATSTRFNNNDIFNGSTFTVDWRSLIPQNVPLGAKFLVTHRFSEQIRDITDDGFAQNSVMVLAQGLPSVQTYTAFTSYSLGGSIINVAEQISNNVVGQNTIAPLNAAATSARYVTPSCSFVCGHPGVALGSINLSFWDVSGNGAPATAEPVLMTDGIHVLEFELISDV